MTKKDAKYVLDNQELYSDKIIKEAMKVINDR